MESGKVITRLCPSCGSYYTDPPAVSRKHKGVNICPECGMKEALEAAGMAALYGETITLFRRAREHEKSMGR